MQDSPRRKVALDPSRTAIQLDGWLWVIVEEDGRFRAIDPSPRRAQDSKVVPLKAKPQPKQPWDVAA